MLTEAGFRTPGFKPVEAVGGDGVGRIRTRPQGQLGGEAAWLPWKAWYAKATPTPQALGPARLTLSNPLVGQLVLDKAKPQGRLHLNRFGQASQSAHRRNQAQAQRAP